MDSGRVHHVVFSAHRYATGTVSSLKRLSLFSEHSYPSHAQPLLLSTSPTRVGHLLQRVNLRGHIMVTRSPQFTLEFTLGVMHFMGLGKYTMTQICSWILQNNATARKTLCTLPMHPLSPNPWKPLTSF